ncbi:MAG TPA: phage portal protein [Allosphingosinicella sp.]|uniref:phage portal protein n=1 Tax=Allosphingosinicella sp. TaxID=2823234 RepID=UPI002EDB231F
MKWFGRKAARASVRPFLLRGFGAGAGEWPRSYEAQVREAYLQNPVAQRAVRLVAEGCGGAVIYSSGVDTPPPRGARSPSPAGGGLEWLVPAALIETVAAQLLLHGNAFVQILCDAEGEPAELFPLRPERVKVEADAGGWPATYLYKAGETRTRIAARDGLGRPGLIHLKAMHPLDDHYGLGCLGAAAGAVAIHNEATRWNKALLDNAARPSGALLYDASDGAVMSGEQFDRVRAELETYFQGSANAGRPMLLEGGMKWQAMSMTPADMNFVELKAAAAREIALAFGVPPMLLGLPGDSTYANYREANRALWRLTILPMMARILGGLSAGLGAWWPGLKLEVDVDRVSALAEEREKLWRQVSGADFLSADEKREMLGFERRQ